MKKRFVYIGIGLLILLAALYFFVVVRSKSKPTALRVEDLPWPVHESDLEVYDGDKIRVELKEGTLTPTRATFIVKNDETYDLTCLTGAFVEIQIDDKWYTLDIHSVVIGFLIRGGDEKEFIEDWGQYCGNLPPGNYRHVKCVMPSAREKISLVCEFTITKDM